ncbi:hypothetical protein DES53_10271 [Roseimicrobium gellanilyticum]|uniref:PRC-barrel domain protein n=1 Tax=Roseimicrobium gellanilyticum TaxID=748857 RepID=A0A366HR22_9BACT|nr:hypothetical protein [Roseimicrobium gellanilyticum]RBP45689.1 hypothetical protein DES53_10271 [Roseimicrobium gellanilyticum]
MKTYLGIIAAVSLAVPWSSPAQEVVDGFSVLKVCQEDLVLHTSDNQDAGHIGYVVVDPGSQRIVSALVTGGVLAERVVAVPYTSVRFRSAREVTLVDINRERLISAPVVERTHLTSTTTRFEPSYFERSYTHFGGNAAELRVGFRSETSTRTDIERDRDRDGRGRDGRGPDRDRDRNRPDATDPSRTDRADTGTSERNRPDSTSRRDSDRTSSTEAQRNQPSDRNTPESRAGENRRGNSRPDGDANRPDSSSERRGNANRPDASSPDSPNNRPGASSDSRNASRPGASTDKPNESANKSATNPPASPNSARKDDQAKEAPTEKKTPGADTTDPANRRPDRDNPENKGPQNRPGESSSQPQPQQNQNSTPGATQSNKGSEADKKPL